jgi:hypothetical protein
MLSTIVPAYLRLAGNLATAILLAVTGKGIGESTVISGIIVYLSTHLSYNVSFILISKLGK